tara:strand:- start:2340 stop:2636 length:297 start_codon:yes stop_codon:yes gene_type:complete
MNIERNDDKEYISVIAIRVKDPETGYDWHCWEKYTRFQMSIADKCLDKEMESEVTRLTKLGFKVSRAGVICCLTETSYDKSILDKLKEKDSFIENYIN